jgi:secretion/DNA translocation related CpaE-like protein
MSYSTTAARPLLVTEDEQLLDAVLRLAAAVGVPIELAGGAGPARAAWSAPPLILVGADQAERVINTRPPRRSAVAVIGHSDDAGLWRRAVELGAERVVMIPDDEGWLIEALSDIGDGATTAAVVLGVVSGRGGAGASIFATSLAMAAQGAGHSTILVDADPMGGGLDLVIGAEDVRGLRWPDLANTRGRLGGSMLRRHLPEKHGLALLSWDRGEPADVPPEAAGAVISAAVRTWEVVVVDLPRTFDPTAAEAVMRCGCVLLVVPPEVRAVAAAARVSAGLASLAPDVRVVVRGPAPAALRASDVAEALGLPLAAAFDSEPGVSRAVERGDLARRSERGPLAEACSTLIAELTVRDQAGAA